MKFQSDAAIISSQKDRLGRSSFALSLAESIIGYDGEESLVIGIYGAWGSGKTSLLNIVTEDLRNESLHKGNQPLIVQFNPWHFSNDEQIIAQFFATLSRALNARDASKELKKAAKIIGTLGHMTAPLKIIPGLAAVGELSADYLKSCEQALERLSDIATKDIDEKKAHIRDLLQHQDRKIVVLIDDIDRLAPEQIGHVFRLVKAVADFPRLVYLLAFDRDVVSMALQQIYGNYGEGYMEKMIQVPFNIPIVSRSQLQKYVTEVLGEMVDQTEHEKWSRERWNTISYDGFFGLFNTLRDVTRYCNLLRFNFTRLRNNVDLNDLFILTAFEALTPSLYNGIIAQRRYFIPSFTDYARRHEPDKFKREALEMLDRLVASVEPNRAPIAKNLLLTLFPKFARDIGAISLHALPDPVALQRGRVEAEDNFLRFFTTGIPVGEASFDDIQRAMEAMNAADPTDLVVLLQQHNTRGTINDLLSRLGEYVKDSDKPVQLKTAITGLIMVGDELKGIPGIIFGDNATHVAWILRALLRREPSHNKRFKLVYDAISDPKASLWATYQVVSDLELYMRKSDGDSADEVEPLISDKQQLSRLKKIAVEKIEEAVKAGALDRHWKRIGILYAWRQWSDNREPKKFLTKILSSDDGLVSLITEIQDNHYRISKDDDLIEVEKVRQQVQKLYKSSRFRVLANDEQRRIKQFLNTDRHNR